MKNFTVIVPFCIDIETLNKFQEKVPKSKRSAVIRDFMRQYENGEIFTSVMVRS